MTNILIKSGSKAKVVGCAPALVTSPVTALVACWLCIAATVASDPVGTMFFGAPTGVKFYKGSSADTAWNHVRLLLLL